MTRSQKTAIQVAIQSTVTNTFAGGQTAEAVVGSYWASQTMADGVEADQANRVFHYPTTTIAAAGSLVMDVYDFSGLDMGAGAGLDPLGQALAVEEIAAILIYKTGAGTLTVDPDPTNGWTPIGTNDLPPGEGLLMKYAPGTFGLDVADGVSNRIRMQATGDDVTVEIIVIGRHDDEASSSSSTSSLSSFSSSSLSTQSTRSSGSSLSSSSTSSSSSSSSVSSSSVSSSSLSSSTQSP